MAEPEASREEFVGEPVGLEEGDGVRGPLRFSWRGRSYVTTEVESRWHDRSQPPGLLKGSWRTRRHRNYFVVRTEGGERFRLYLDRGTGKGPRRWILDRRLPGEAGG